MYTNKTARYMANNLVYMAKLMKANPIPTNLKQLIADAEAASLDDCPPSHGAPIR
jgi:hypothetical protein